MENERKAKVTFVISSIVDAVLAAFVYQNYVFRSLPGLSYIASEIVFYVLLISFVSIETAFWFNKPKEFYTLYINIITPIGIYTSIAYFQDLWVLTVLVGGIVLVLNILIFKAVLSSKSTNTSLTKKVIRKRIQKAYKPVQIISAIGFSVISLPVIVSALLFRSVYGPFESYITPWQDKISVGEDNIQKLRVFAYEDEWTALDQHKKIEALQTMANIYASEFGIPHELIVTLIGMNRVTYAGYHDSSYTISYNISYFNDLSAKEALKILMHECTHAYQCCYVDALKDVDKKYYNMKVVQKALKYDKEFTNYISGYFDYEAYSDQWCEIDANESADVATEMYLQRIRYYAEKE